MILGGLDIATTTGTAVMRDGIITTQALRYGGAKKKSIWDDEKSEALDANELGRVFKWFDAAIRIWLVTNEIDEVAIEEPLRTDFSRKKTTVDTAAAWAGRAVRVEKMPGTNLKTIFKIHGLEAQACKVCSELNIPVRFANQSKWRKAFMGNGRPADAKQEAKKECERRGIVAVTLDSAEAAGIVSWLNQQINPYTPAANGLFKLPATVRAGA